MRRYRMTPQGEKPVWASARKLRELGRLEGVQAFTNGQRLVRWGNRDYDAAAAEAYAECERKAREAGGGS